jgi:DNA-directed RNA polymerase specialized sigma24 family protein
LTTCGPIVRDDREAEDVTQHVFAKLITIVGRYDDHRIRFVAWLLRIAPGEIAGCMGRTESSVHGLHHRGRQALQRELTRLDSAPLTRNRDQLVAA